MGLWTHENSYNNKIITKKRGFQKAKPLFYYSVLNIFSTRGILESFSLIKTPP